MISLSTVEAKLPPGFRFHPKDEELVCNYLMKWVAGCTEHSQLLIQVDLNKCEPWDIPESACVGGKEWYFYSQRDRKYATGLRTNRATVSGYWKATGKDRPVVRKGGLVGMRKTLVFYQGRAPRGRKTEWVMHEFRLEGALGLVSKHATSLKADWVLCRMFYKSRSETPIKDEKWSDNHFTLPSSSLPLSLPPLTQPFTAAAAFHQNHPAPPYHYNQQVPCFSNAHNIVNPTNPTFPSFSPAAHGTGHQEPTHPVPSFEHTTISHLHQQPSLAGPTNPYSCDDNVVKFVLSHLSRGRTESEDDKPVVVNGSASLGEGSSESFLSEVGLCSSIWDQY